MSKATRSIQVWSAYVLVIGAALALVPNFVLSTLGLDETDEVWIRILGVVVVILALYYWDAARNNARHLYVASLLGRGFAVGAFVVLVITGEPWQLLIFAALDLAGLVWTASALRSDAA